LADAFDRDYLIELLDRLDGTDDQSVLAAVRAATETLRSAGLDWDDVIAARIATKAAPASSGENEPEAAPVAAGTTDESLALIDRLLARSDISDALKSELDGYKADIAAGNFEEADGRYVRQLAQRLEG
jgi:hypothetical protein